MWYNSLVILLYYGFGWTRAEMSQDLEIDGNVTEQKAHAMDFLKMDFHHTGVPLGICTTILLVALIKPLIIKIRWIPPSILLLIFGFVASYTLSFIPEMPDILVFHPDLFFELYLPFIIADAGWFLPMKEFFHNINQISLYAVMGTLLNAILTCVFMRLVSFAFATQDISFLSLFTFSVIISAVDPVAVISVFEDVQVNERLNILVFGESLLNDGVVIVLYQSMNKILIFGEENVTYGKYIQIIPLFFWVVGFGIGFGVLFGFVGVVMQRLYVAHQALMPAIALVIPYMSYLIADSFGFSGLVAIMTCCIIMKNFASGNVCLEMQYTAEFIYKNLGSYSESFIFVVLGYSSATIIREGTDWNFVLLAIIGIIAIRFLVVFTLTYITNLFAKFREDRIGWRDQFIMAYGGLRGAVCYGLIASMDPLLLKEKNVYVCATIIIVMFTTIVQGSTIRAFVNFLSVEKKSENDDQKKTTLHHAMYLTTKHVTRFMEDVTANHEENSLFRWVRAFDGSLRSFLCYYQKPKGIALLEDQMEEETFYRKGTSFAGLPTDHSLASMRLPTSKSELFAAGYNETALLPPSRPVPKPSIPKLVLPPSSPIPRNESVSDILPTIFNTDLERESTKHKRKSVYNRHILGYHAPADPNQSTDRPDEEEVDDNQCQMTFPYAKSLNQKILAQQARSMSKSVKDHNGQYRFRSPHRAMTSKEAESPYKTYHASTSRSTAKRTFPPPRFTITDEESPSPPTSVKPGRAKTERKITTGTKTFVVGAEDESLMPINEDDDSQSSH